MTKPRWQRILLKISGEALASSECDKIIDNTVSHRIADEILQVQSELQVEIAIVVGGGNIWRGAAGKTADMDPIDADNMGMLATVINALALKDALKRSGANDPRVMSAIPMHQVTEDYILGRALSHMRKGRIPIFAAGTGNPLQTTDYAAALRGVSVEADVLMKATHSTDGVYSADPNKVDEATKYDEISYRQVITSDLEAMDLESIHFCRRHALPIYVFNIMQPGHLRRALAGECVGTLVS